MLVLKDMHDLLVELKAIDAVVKAKRAGTA
jgi:hypothetical protein